MANKLRRLAAAVLLASITAANAATYNLVVDYSGQSFFDGWSYYGSYDNLTNGPSLINKSRSLARLSRSVPRNRIHLAGNLFLYPVRYLRQQG